MRERNKSKPASRFGIGEWFGYQFDKLPDEERLDFANNLNESRPCPFRTDGKSKCTKRGGVCSYRMYTPIADSGEDLPLCKPVDGPRGGLRISCPYRFQESNTIFEWASKVILGADNPMAVKEVDFHVSPGTLDSEKGKATGKIDEILATIDHNGDLQWCALEIQGVYFSGDAMSNDFKGIREADGQLCLPAGRRRMDYRSSGPKRLMPQLQIKVPTLRRWGKRMAVVVDRSFFDSMGEMDIVDDISNCDIVWLIVDLDVDAIGKRAKLVKDEVRFTTLERAVEGLTGGTPVTMQEFERLIRRKLNID